MQRAVCTRRLECNHKFHILSISAGVVSPRVMLAAVVCPASKVRAKKSSASILAIAAQAAFFDILDELIVRLVKDGTPSKSTLPVPAAARLALVARSAHAFLALGTASSKLYHFKLSKERRGHLVHPIVISVETECAFQTQWSGSFCALGLCYLV